MEGALDPMDFVLAEKLHKSLAEVHAMPNAEFVQWRAFFRYRSEMQKLEGTR